MPQKKRPLGTVKFGQIQPERMIVETPDGLFFDSTHRLEVDCLAITAEGIGVLMADGETILDVHHAAYPGGRNKPGNAVSIGFTAHYRAMRSRFGDHLVDGSAGENVIIEFPAEVWLDDLGTQLLFENPETGHTALLDVNRIATPCDPFSHFAANHQHARLPEGELKSILQFLGQGRRGFLLGLNLSQRQAFIRPGDQVYAVGE